MKNLWEQFLIRVFVDNLTLCKYWRCHQLSERSFFVRGRQFHLCARCTGIITGYFLSPLAYFTLGEEVTFYFIICAMIIALDGFTQLWKLRESANILRFVTGLSFGLTFPSFCFVILIKIFHLIKECYGWQ